MILLIEDFVNREEQLATLWQMVRQEVSQRVLLIYAPTGMGKTYLLDEFQDECQAEGIACARIDFAESADQNYLTIVLQVRSELGTEGFEPLNQAIEKARTDAAWETVPGPTAATRVEGPPAEGGRLSGRGGGVDFRGPATIYGDVIGRDAIYHITQIIQRDDPVVQQVIQADITDAFHECLAELTAARQVVFLIDSWERATTDTGDWLRRHLLKWILDKKLPGAVAAVGGSQVPDLQRPPRGIRRLTLDGLPKEAVHMYWTEKYGLPAEDVPHVIRLSKREPYLLALMADRQLIS